MNKHELRVVDYVDHMLDAMDRIERYTKHVSVETFVVDTMLQDAVVRNIGILGDGAANILYNCPNFISRHTDNPWRDIHSMRNRVVLGCHTVEADIVWQAVQRDILALKDRLHRVRHQMAEPREAP